MVNLFPKRPNFTSETCRARILRNNAKLCAQLLEVQDEICYDSSKNAVLHGFRCAYVFLKINLKVKISFENKNLMIL